MSPRALKWSLAAAVVLLAAGGGWLWWRYGTATFLASLNALMCA